MVTFNKMQASINARRKSPTFTMKAAEMNVTDSPTEVSKRLGKIVVDFSEAINTQDRAHLQQVTEQHFAATLEARVGEPFDALLAAISRDEFIDNFMVFFAEWPDFYNHWEQPLVETNQKLGRARIFQTYASSGVVQGAQLVRESVVMFEFEREQLSGRWVGVRISVIQGPGHTLFDVDRRSNWMHVSKHSASDTHE